MSCSIHSPQKQNDTWGKDKKCMGTLAKCPPPPNEIAYQERFRNSWGLWQNVPFRYPGPLTARPVFSGEGAMFLFTHNNTQLYEVLRFEEPFRSWFVGDSVERGMSMEETLVSQRFVNITRVFRPCGVNDVFFIAVEKPPPPLARIFSSSNRHSRTKAV